MSPFGATATAEGRLKVSGPFPGIPALPSVIKIFPSGLNLKTWWPFPCLPASSLVAPPPTPSVTQTFPSLSTKRPWGYTNIPAPKFFRSLPDDSNSSNGASSEPAQVFPPHRSYVHMLPSGLIATPDVDPHFLPSGNCAQFRTV